MSRSICLGKTCHHQKKLYRTLIATAAAAAAIAEYMRRMPITVSLTSKLRLRKCRDICSTLSLCSSNQVPVLSNRMCKLSTRCLMRYSFFKWWYMSSPILESSDWYNKTSTVYGITLLSLAEGV